MTAISLNNIVTRNDGNLMGGEMGDETVMMDMTSGDYLGLNGVGTSIWKIIEQTTKVSDIVNKLMGEYEVDQATCETETLKYLNELAKENLIIIQ